MFGVKLKKMQRVIVFLLFIVAVAAQSGATDTTFDSRHQVAIRQNPAGLRLSLRTVDGGSTFHLFETIPIEIAYSTTRPDTFTIEMDEAMNFAGGNRKFDFDDTDGILFTELEWRSRGIVCCESDKRPLSQKPASFKRELTDYLRFQKPGTYRIFLTTRRVFRIGGNEKQFERSKIALTSNILTLTILPDDADWDARRLAALLKDLDSPRLKGNHDSLKKKIDRDPSELRKYQAMANELDHTPYALAQKALNALDTPEAIRERVSRMELTSSKYPGSQADYESKTIFYQPLLASTIRPDLVAAAMESRARQPDFGVDYDYAYYWAQFAAERDTAGVLRRYDKYADGEEYKKRIRSFFFANVEAEKQIISELSAHLDEKTGRAREITALTIKNLNDDVTQASKYSVKAE